MLKVIVHHSLKPSSMCTNKLFFVLIIPEHLQNKGSAQE